MVAVVIIESLLSSNCSVVWSLDECVVASEPTLPESLLPSLTTDGVEVSPLPGEVDSRGKSWVYIVRLSLRRTFYRCTNQCVGGKTRLCRSGTKWNPPVGDLGGNVSWDSGSLGCGCGAPENDEGENCNSEIKNQRAGSWRLCNFVPWPVSHIVERFNLRDVASLRVQKTRVKSPSPAGGTATPGQ